MAQKMRSKTGKNGNIPLAHTQPEPYQEEAEVMVEYCGVMLVKDGHGSVAFVDEIGSWYWDSPWEKMADSVGE